MKLKLEKTFSLLTVCCICFTACSQAGPKNEEARDEHRRAIKALKQHLNEKNERVESDITVLKSTFTEWPDASLGCPAPGFYYPQVVTPGYRVILDYGGKPYYVHLSEKKGKVCEYSPVLKNNNVSRGKPVKLNKLRISSMIERAKADLSKRINVSEEKITLASSEPVTWKDTSLGCPIPDSDYTKKEIKGFVFKFAANQRIYTYHSDALDRFIPCPKILDK